MGSCEKSKLNRRDIGALSKSILVGKGITREMPNPFFKLIKDGSYV